MYLINLKEKKIKFFYSISCCLSVETFLFFLLWASIQALEKIPSARNWITTSDFAKIIFRRQSTCLATENFINKYLINWKVYLEKILSVNYIKMFISKISAVQKTLFLKLNLNATLRSRIHKYINMRENYKHDFGFIIYFLILFTLCNY